MVQVNTPFLLLCLKDFFFFLFFFFSFFFKRFMKKGFILRSIFSEISPTKVQFTFLLNLKRDLDIKFLKKFFIPEKVCS